MTATNHRDPSLTFGHIALGDNDFPTVYVTKTEADLRRSLASLAYAYGWDVREEVVIPGFGRIDIVLEAPGETYLVELKIDLTKPARIRRAFQQADGYGRWWSTNVGDSADVFLVGQNIDEEAIKSVADAYWRIPWRTVGDMLYWLERGRYGSDVTLRAAKAKARAEEIARVSDFHAHAARRLESREQVPA